MKQKSKKLLSLLLALTMIMSMLSVSAFAAGTNPFTDVSSDDWYYDEVLYVYENDLMNGTSTTAFSPDVTVNRAMMVTILYRLDGEPAVSTSGTFTDVTTGQYYTDAVEWAVANEITNGYGNGLFGPNDQLTREQMATFYYRYAEYKGYDVSTGADLSGYTDVGSVSAYALDAFEWTNANGLITGTTTTTLSPQGDATRAQLAVILYRYCHNVVDEVEEYTVTFEYNYGNKGAYMTVTVDDCETVDQPSNPTRSGYSFSGWYTKASGGEKFDFDTAITADLTLYAHWSSNSGGGGGHTHSYSSEITIAATCTTDGMMTYTCSCGESYTKTIDATGVHTPDATTGLCSGCGVYCVDATNAQTALNAADSGSTLELAAGTYSSLVIDYRRDDITSGNGSATSYYEAARTLEGLTIDGDGDTTVIEKFDINDYHLTNFNGNVTIGSGAHVTGDYTLGTLTIKNVKFTGDVVLSDAKVVADSIIFEGCTFADCGFQLSIHDGDNIGDVQFINCTFTNEQNESLDRQIYMLACVDNTTNLIIDGCSFDGAKYNAVQVNKSSDSSNYSNATNSCDVTINGSTISNTGNRALRFNGFTSGTVTITNNEFSNADDTNGECFKASDVNSDVAFAWNDNTADGVELTLITSNSDKIGVLAVNGAVREWGMLTYNEDESFNGDNVVLTVYNADQFKYALTHTDELYDAVKKETGISNNTLLYPQTWCLTLGDDINFSMDDPSDAIAPFEWKFGRVNGNDCTISNVYISSTQSGTSTNPVKVGLFDNLVNAAVSNLNLKNIHVTAAGNDAYVGTLTGMSQGDLSNVSVDGFSVTATGTGAYTGGLIGNSAGNKTNCSVTSGTIAGGKNVGGFAGYISVENANNTLSDCSVSVVRINASNESGRNTIGSFAGRLNEASGSLTLTNCTVNNVTGTDVPTDRIYGDIPTNPVTINGTEYSKDAT